MDFLIDTNVFIERERDWVVPEPLQNLENRLKTRGHTILIHPLSKEEVRKYENKEGRERAESKIATYAELSFPRYPTSSDTEFRCHVPEGSEFNEQVDNALLYTVFQDRADYLITEDKGIHRKARNLKIKDRVLSIEEAQDQFESDHPPVKSSNSIQKVQVEDLDLSDPIFDSLKKKYEFKSWFKGVPDRDAYVNWNPDGTLGAVLIIKPNEAETLGEDSQLGKRERLKISTLKVATGRRGSKIGELLISISIREAIQHELEEVYLTHHVEQDDYLVQLISQYGFKQTVQTSDGEDVFVKRLTPGLGDDPNPFEVNIRFYPSFYDGPEVRKFLIPVKPEFHSRLFPTYEKRHPKLTEFTGQFLSEGNAIKKAYLSHANTKQIRPRDILFFYRSHDYKEITTLGVCEQVEYGVEDDNKVFELVNKRSVFTKVEINEMVEKPTMVLLFKWHFELEHPLRYQELRDEGVLSGPPQTIQQLDEKCYQYIRASGGIDERFIVD